MQLEPHVKSIVGVDISQGMIDQFTKRLSDKGISQDKVKPLVAELTGEEGELDNAKFDIVVVRLLSFSSRLSPSHRIPY
jgi:ubiquinone/menaquinone biosynthesis C-methylase UbiE